ncbi:MAG: helix-turn-helix domain-containing protein [Elusimicrobiota bacterium]
MAIQRTYFPLHEALKGYVRYCVLKEASTGDGKPARNKIQADLWPSLVVNLNSGIRQVQSDGSKSKLSRVSLMGVGATPGEYEVGDGSRILSFNFVPGMAHPFFGFGLSQFTDMAVDLQDCWGKEGRLLEERIDAAASPLQIKEAIEAALLERLKDSGGYPKQLLGAVGMAMSSVGRASVEQLAEDTSCSRQYLKRLFTEWVGHTPKVFSRVVRFQAVCDSLKPGMDPDWTDLAFDFGYADQSHLIRDFVEFAGLSPSRFFDIVIRATSPESEVWRAMQPDVTPFCAT